MSPQLDTLRLTALNIDGVLLNDTFSPIIHQFVTRRGGSYTAELERRIFSQPQLVTGRILAEVGNMSTTPQETIDIYLQEREHHLSLNPVRVLDGAVELLHRLRGLGSQTVCYGGLDASHFTRYLGNLADLFDGPSTCVCTNGFRPGVREITTTVFQLALHEALFVDDVARVAETTEKLGVSFVGHPSNFEHSFQRQLMEEAGVRHVVDSLDGIDEALLRTIDTEAAPVVTEGAARSSAVREPSA